MSGLRALLAALLFLFSLQCAAHQDRVAQWTAVTLHALVHGLPTVVTAEVDKDELKRIQIKYGNQSFEIPANALLDIPSPRLNTIQVLFETHPAITPLPGVSIRDELRKPRPYFYVSLDFGPPMDVGEPPYPLESKVAFANVQYHFLDGEYRERWIWRPTGPGSSKLESDCKPEEAARYSKRCLLD
jgi:hypothetical protein